MQSWKTLSEIVGATLGDLYSDGRLIGDERWRLEAIDGVIERSGQQHLNSAVLLAGNDGLSNLTVRMKPYVDAGNCLKDLHVGNFTRQVVPSLVLDKRGTERFNTLAMFVKCRWKTKQKNLAINYANALACILNRTLPYKFALCVELELDSARSKAFMTTKDHVASTGSEWEVDKLLSITDDRPITIPSSEVARLRKLFFIDVSADVFSLPAATL